MPAKFVVWIKLYLSTLTDYKFSQLDDNERWYFIGLLLLYPQCKNAIPYDRRWLGRRLKKDGTEMGQELDKIIKLFRWRVKNGKIYIRNFKKYQHYKKLGTGIDQVYTKSIPYKDTKQEEDKEEDKEKTTTQQGDGVASQIHSIFKGSMKQSKIQNLIKGKDPDEMLRLAHYCSEEGENPPGLFTTMVKENAEVPKRKAGKPKIPPPPGGYQSGKGPLLIDDVQAEKVEPEEKKIDESDRKEEEAEEEFQERMRRDVERFKKLCKSNNLGDPIHKQLGRLRIK